MQKYVRTALAIFACSWMLALVGTAQTTQDSSKAPSSQASSEHAPGKHALPGVKVAFTPGMVDKDGKVIPAVPNVSKFEGEEEGPSLTAKGLADKARAEVGEFKMSKPKPSQAPAGKAGFLPQSAKGTSSKPGIQNTWKISQGGKIAKPTSNIPFSGNNFEGGGDTGTEPPDVASAAGPLQIVASTNFTINTYDKTGNLQSSQDFESFFSPLGDPSTWFLFDPVVQYDPYIGRFFLVVVGRNDATKQSDLLIAMSADSDVRLGWTLWFVDITQDGSNASNNWCDYPHLGLDTSAIYMTCNQFQFGGNFQYAKIRMMLKSQFLNNTCCQWFDHWNIHDGNNGLSFAIQPAMMRTGDTGEFLADTQGLGGSGSTLQLFHIPDPVNNPGQLDKSSIGISGYAPPPSAQQPNGVTGIDTGDTRLLFATYESGHVSVGQNANCGGNSCAAFYEVNVSAFPTLTLVNDWALQSLGTDYYYPAVDQNSNADKTLVYTRSSPDEFAGSNFLGIPNSGTCTLCVDGPEVPLAAGLDTYSRICCGNRNRWGDYFTASADPDGLGVWIAGENVVSQDSWGTQIAATYNRYAPFGVLSSDPVDFGKLAIFLPTFSITQFVSNTGNASMLLGAITLTGDPGFSVGFDGCSGALVQPNSFCEVVLQFTPSVIGAHSATFTAPYNKNLQAQTQVIATVTQAGTITSVISAPNPSTAGEAVKLTAMVASQTSGTPNGKVTFKDGSTTLAVRSLSGGIATFTTASLAKGTHSITASYDGSGNFLTSSGPTTQVVNPPATATALSSSLNPSTFGKTVTFRAAITSNAPGTITGNVTFMDGASTIGTGTVNAGIASFATAALSGGTHSITARYNGSTNFAGSTSAALSEKVNQAATTTTLTAAPNPSSFGQSVIFTATVKSGSLLGTGSVTFKSGGQTLATRTLNSSGNAILTFSALPAGTNTVTAVYAGNANFLGSTSAGLTEVVHKAATTTTLASSGSPATHGTAVTFTATITPAFKGNPTGTVTFKDGSTVIGTAGVSGSTHQAKITTSTLAVGTHQITASYGGQANFSASTSAVLQQVIQ